MMHYTFFLFGLCNALDESTTTAAPSVQDPDCGPCATWGWNGCKTCVHGYVLQQKTYNGIPYGICVKKCSCPNGVAATGAHCPPKGGEVCATCNQDYFLNEENKCEFRICTCKYGLGARGENCNLVNNKPGAQCKARGCRPSFIFYPQDATCKKLNGKKCQKNDECFSANCAVTTGRNDSSLTCQCGKNCGYEGQISVKTGRVPNESACDSFCSEKTNLGRAKYWSFVTSKVIGPNCSCYPSDAVPTPESNTNSGEVQYTVCQCDNGTPVSRPCTTSIPQRCEKCKGGYELMGEQCMEKQCQCKNGIGSEAKNCPLAGAWNCRACKIGFHEAENALAAQTTTPNPIIPQVLCVENICKCKNGFAATGRAILGANRCDVDGAKQCIRCNPGYFLQNGKCMENQCSCSPVLGTAAKGLSCPTTGNTFCIRCNSGYHLKTINGVSTGRCLRNDSEQEDILV